MLNYTKIYQIIERSLPGKGRIPFSMLYIKKNGEEREYKNVICLSSHFRPPTINIQLTSGEVKKIRTIGIVHINGLELHV